MIKGSTARLTTCACTSVTGRRRCCLVPLGTPQDTAQKLSFGLRNGSSVISKPQRPLFVCANSPGRSMPPACIRSVHTQRYPVRFGHFFAIVGKVLNLQIAASFFTPCCCCCQSEWLQVPRSYLPLWRQLGFSPASAAKTLAYAVLAPAGSAAVVAAFMRVRYVLDFTFAFLCFSDSLSVCCVRQHIRLFRACTHQHTHHPHAGLICPVSGVAPARARFCLACAGISETLLPCFFAGRIGTVCCLPARHYEPTATPT
jgi:hypothetical protein